MLDESIVQEDVGGLEGVSNSKGTKVRSTEDLKSRLS